MEILIKSDIPKKEFNDVGLLKWGQQASIDSDWLRSKSSESGFKPEKMLKKSGMGMIAQSIAY